MEYVTAAAPALRVQAALTLGEIGTRAALDALANLLADEQPQVRVAAAGAILQILK
jgi:HEAT repeat protein